MAARLPLVNGGSTSLSSALKNEQNMLERLSWARKNLEARDDLAAQCKQGLVQDLVASHFGISEKFTKTWCVVESVEEWLWGSFNWCIPIRINSGASGNKDRKVLLRCPMEYRLRDAMEEKLRCEAATYIWMQENCPEIPIPQLFAFGFPDGRHVRVPLLCSKCNRLTIGYQ